jgi:hypothetical protein
VPDLCTLRLMLTNVYRVINRLKFLCVGRHHFPIILCHFASFLFFVHYSVHLLAPHYDMYFIRSSYHFLMSPLRPLQPSLRTRIFSSFSNLFPDTFFPFRCPRSKCYSLLSILSLYSSENKFINNINSTNIVETSVRNKCRCSFYCALFTLHVSALIGGHL